MPEPRKTAVPTVVPITAALASIPGLVGLTLGATYALGAIEAVSQVYGAGLRPVDVLPLVPLPQILGRGIAQAIFPFGAGVLAVVLVVMFSDRVSAWEMMATARQAGRSVGRTTGTNTWPAILLGVLLITAAIVGGYLPGKGAAPSSEEAMSAGASSSTGK